MDFLFLRLNSSKMFNDFLQHIKFQKRCSEHTVTAYRTDLEQFSLFLLNTYSSENLAEADFPQLRAWVVALSELKLDTRSINRKMATLRTFYGYLLKNKTIIVDPTLKLKALKTDRTLPTFVREKEMDTLLDDIDFGNDFEGLRDKLVIELLYGTGMRLAELIGLKDSDIDAYQRTLTVLGKRNKHRVIPIHQNLFALIQSYQAIRQNTLKFSANLLIVTNLGNATYPMLIQRIVKKYLSLVSTLDKKSPHVLRHTFATHLLNKGADINAIKDLLGHSSLAATQIYTHNSIEKLKETYLKAHPKSGI